MEVTTLAALCVGGHSCLTLSDEQVLAALDGVDEQMTQDERREDLYLSALEHYVAALGGRLEVRAVFGEDEIVVRPARDDGGS